MTRLPTPGQDAGQWGTILNEYLSQVHKPDGSLKDNVVTAGALAPNAVSASSLIGTTGTDGQVLTIDAQAPGGFAWKAIAGGGTFQQVNADWDATSGVAQILHKPTLNKVATSGSYTDLADKPTIPTKFSDLTDVSATSPTGGDILSYDGTNNKWQSTSVDAIVPDSSSLVADVSSTVAVNTYSGLPTIDGVALADGMIVLLTAEVTASKNGLWVAHSGAWTRPSNYATGTNVAGKPVIIKGGDNGQGTIAIPRGVGPLTVDSSSLLWSPFRNLKNRGNVNAWSVYYPGDIVNINRGNTQVIITSGCQANGSAFISSANYTLLNYNESVDIRWFGAKVDGASDDTVAIQNAINSFGTAGSSIRGSGGTVKIPVGTTRISATLELPSNVHLKGSGWAVSVIQLMPNSNCDMIRTHRSTGAGDSNSFWSSVTDLMLDGRYLPGTYLQGTTVSDCTITAGSTTITSAGQRSWVVGELVQGVGLLPGTKITASSGLTATLSQPATYVAEQNGAAGSASVLVGEASGGRPWCAIYHETNPYNTAQSGDNQFDPTHLFARLWIYGIAGDGIRLAGRSDILIEHVKVSHNHGSGFVIDFDTGVSNCVTERTVGHGLIVNGHSSNRISNCKFYNAYAYGMYLLGGGGIGEITVAGVDLQQNNLESLYIKNFTTSIICQAITISQTGFSNKSGQVASGRDIPAVVLDNCSRILVDAATKEHNSALKIINNCSLNDIRIAQSSSISGAKDLATTSQTDLGSNRITINGAVINPKPTLTGLSDVTLTNPTDGQTLVYQGGKWVNVAGGGGGGSFYGGLFGDGALGAVTLDGTNTYSGIIKLSATEYQLNSDVYCSALTINNGVTLATNGGLIFCTGTVTNNGTITADGGPASGNNGATVPALGATAASGTGRMPNGGNGNTAAGSQGNPGAIAVGTGGGGGAGATGAAGGGGNVTSGGLGAYSRPYAIASGSGGFFGTTFAISGGSGGGGGGGDGTNRGGGGGQGGGVIAIYAHAFVNTGTISSKGGAGFTPTLGNCGGGGGGGGGTIISYTLSPWTNTGTTTVTGGAGAAGVGTGAAGINGGAGKVTNIVLT